MPVNNNISYFHMLMLYNKTVIFIIIISLIATVIWIGTLFSTGIYDYADGLAYFSQGRYLTERGTDTPCPISYQNFENNDESIKEYIKYPGRCYSLLIHVISKLFFDEPRLWHGIILSYLSFIFGSVFCFLFIRKFVLPEFSFILWFLGCICYANLYIARPLTQMPSWAIFMLLLYISTFKRKQYILSGLLFGIAAAFRAQMLVHAIFFPLLLMFDQNTSVRKILSKYILFFIALIFGYFATEKICDLYINHNSIVNVSTTPTLLWYAPLFKISFQRIIYVITHFFSIPYGYGLFVLLISLFFQWQNTKAYRMGVYTLLTYFSVYCMLAIIDTKYPFDVNFNTYIYPFTVLLFTSLFIFIKDEIKINTSVVSVLQPLSDWFRRKKYPQLSVILFIFFLVFFVCYSSIRSVGTGLNRFYHRETSNIFSDEERELSNLIGKLPADCTLLTYNNTWTYCKQFSLSEHLVYVPIFTDFLNGKCNQKVDVIILFKPSNRNLSDIDQTWKSVLDKEVIEDNNGNKFIRKIASPKLTVFIKDKTSS